MRWLIFLSKVAFLSGLLMILAISLLAVSWNGKETITTSIINAGYVLALVMIPFINILYLMLTVFGKKPWRIVPRWIFLINILCFIILIAFIFYFNDSYYYQ